MVSYNPYDIENRYCGSCHDFHDNLTVGTPMKIKMMSEQFHNLDIKKLTRHAHATDAGIDLVSCITTNLFSRVRTTFPTGIAVEIPNGYFGLVQPRSGLASVHGITTCSSGIIDSGYRGEIKVTLINHSSKSHIIKIGDRIAQLIVLPYLPVSLEWVEELPLSDRGDKGHGSTGR